MENKTDQPENEKNYFSIPQKSNVPEDKPDDLKEAQRATELSDVERETSINEMLINTGEVTGPVVAFVGPRSSGKTVALIRLIEYMNSKGVCDVAPNTNFISGPAYEKVANDFMASSMNRNYNPERTGNINFLLMNCFVEGKLKCQILEAPGEHYFSTDTPNDSSYKHYLSTILFHSKYRKVLVLFFEQGMLQTDEMQQAYAHRLSDMVNQMDKKNDRLVILFNKVDKFRGKMTEKSVKDLIYKNPNYKKLTGTIDANMRSSVGYLSFSGGTFHNTADPKKMSWAKSTDDYPSALWKQLSNAIDGSWSGFRLW